MRLRLAVGMLCCWAVGGASAQAPIQLLPPPPAASAAPPPVAAPTPTPPVAAPPPAPSVAAPTPAPAPIVPKEMSPPDSWVPKGTAELIVLDKLRAQPVALTVKTGQSVTYGSLTITVKSCEARPPDLPQNSTAFLEIMDSRGSAAVFDGWIFSTTPSVSQFEHPVYDVRLVRCS